MDASPQPTGSETTILDLNDDCLRAVFDVMAFDDLTVAADVCTRFRQNAVETAHLKFKQSNGFKWSQKNWCSQLRIFGGLLESVCVEGGCELEDEPQVEFPKRAIELLTKYCAKTIIKLKLDSVDLSDEFALLMQPMLKKVRRLEFDGCFLGEVFLRNLAIWSPELRELIFKDINGSKDGEMSSDFLHQKYPKLEYVDFDNVNVKNSDIGEFLKQNAQLKRIGVKYCNEIDDSIFQLIAEHVPEIEEIQFETMKAINTNNAKHLRQLCGLKSLKIFTFEGDPQPVVYEIASANTPLENLDLSCFAFRYPTQQFLDGIAKLKNLKKLRMQKVQNMTASQFLKMCKPLKELSEMEFSSCDLGMTEDDLLSFIQNAEKLQKFNYFACSPKNCVEITIDTFKKLVEIVERRSKKTPLTLDLDCQSFIANIPSGITEAANDLLELKITDAFLSKFDWSVLTRHRENLDPDLFD